MKIRTLLILMVLYSINIHAQNYVPTDKGSKLEFNTSLNGTAVRVTFKEFKGEIIFDPHNLKNALIDITIKTNNLQTGIPKADNDLKSVSYFNVGQYPEIKFKSTSITQDVPGSIVYKMAGNITIKGISKPINVQFTTTPSSSGLMFRGSFRTNSAYYNFENSLDNMLVFFLEIRTNKL